MKPRAERLGLSDLPSVLVFGWTVALLVQGHAFFLAAPQALHAYDEGYIAVFAARMVEGRMLPFVDAVSHRGPMTYWAVALLGWIWEPMSWMPIRVAALVATLATAAGTFVAAWRAGHAFAGAIASAALGVVFLVDLPPMDGIAYNGEHILNAFAMPSLACAIIALDRARSRPGLALLALSGALGAMGALGKQVGVASLFAQGLWVVAAAVSRPGLARSERWRMVLSFVLGAAAPVACVVARYAATGELRTLWYWAVTYNADVYMAPMTGSVRSGALRAFIANRIVLLAIAAPLVVWAATRPIALAGRPRDLARAYDDDGLVATVGIGAGLVIVASNATLRDFRHYYVQIVPWVGLLLGLAVERAMGPRTKRRAWLVRCLALVPLVALLGVGWDVRIKQYQRDRERGRAWPDKHLDGVCKAIAAKTLPEDRIFVWGFAPELYIGCGRRPASRFVYTTMVAGLVPWFPAMTKDEENRLAAPGSRELLLEDLERSSPLLVVDAPKSMADRSMKRYEALAAWLAQRYCSSGKVDDFELYVRKDPGGRCR